ncbi:hypothetical protein GQ600_22031 [Phytophthora cactorum]|nr:hypothetical protein GQ600_22031 [Phytophthora cactorum]
MVYRTPQEKMLIVHTHKYIFGRGSATAGSPGTTVRERVAKSLAVSESMVARVLAAYNVHGEEAFAVPADHQGGAYVEQQPPSEIAQRLLWKSCRILPARPPTRSIAVTSWERWIPGSVRGVQIAI